jgi:hypothetical protein
LGKTVNNLGSPAFLLLPCEDFPSNLPVQEDQLFVDGKGCLDLRPANARLEALEKDIIVIGGEKEIVWRHGTFPLFL